MIRVLTFAERIDTCPRVRFKRGSRVHVHMYSGCASGVDKGYFDNCILVFVEKNVLFNSPIMEDFIKLNKRRLMLSKRM